MFATEKAGRFPDIFSEKKPAYFFYQILNLLKVESRKVEKVESCSKVEKVEKVDYSSESGESITKVEVGDESRFLMSSTL